MWSCSIAEYSVDNSLIKPTYMLTHESASELLHLNLKEEADLKLLSEAATLRLQWRLQQVCLNKRVISRFMIFYPLQVSYAFVVAAYIIFDGLW